MEYTPELYAMCSQCLWNTLATTIRRKEDGSIFVITGDIPDMWIRDSAAQVHPYVFLATKNSTSEIPSMYGFNLIEVVEGTLVTQAFNILEDPYANSYHETPVNKSLLNPHERELRRGGYVATGNYELDSGCYFFRLMYEIWKIAGSTRVLVKEKKLLIDATNTLLDIWQIEQNHEKKSLYRYPELTREGLGSETIYTGLLWSGFRPSDEPCKHHYLIPSNIFAIKVLQEVEEISNTVWKNKDITEKAKKLRASIKRGLEKYGIHTRQSSEKVYCYEVDGLGNCNLIDDANIPSLLSLPYLDRSFSAFDKQIYQNTRKMILSKENKFYYTGHYARGIGSSHTPKDYIWPMSLIMQAMTSTDILEKKKLVEILQTTTAGTNFMHESFDDDIPTAYTRRWFAWANSLFAELLFQMTGEWCDKRFNGFDPEVQKSITNTNTNDTTIYDLQTDVHSRRAKHHAKNKKKKMLILKPISKGRKLNQTYN